MTIKKFQGKTQEEATEKARQELGAGAVVMNVKEIKPKGLFNFFKGSTFEVTAAIEEKEQFLNAVQMAAMQQKKIENINLAADEKISIPLPAEKTVEPAPSYQRPVTPEKEVHIDDNIFNPVGPMTELKTVEIQDFDEYTKLSDDIFKNVSNARNASISLINDGDNVFVSVASGDSIYTVQEPYLSKEQILSGVRELFDRLSKADNRESFAKIYVNNMRF